MATAPQTFRLGKPATQTYKPHSPRAKTADRGYDGQWQKISRMYRRQHPECEEEGCEELAECVDHKVPFRGKGDPLRTDWSNLRALCWRHHSQKTAREDGGFGHERKRND